MKKCSLCGGKVRRALLDNDPPTDRYTCQKCGRVKDIKRPVDVIDMSASKKKVCPKCEGDGFIVTGAYSYGGVDQSVCEDCPDCEGEGIVDVGKE